VWGDRWQKLRERGAEVYYADADLRAAFARAKPGVLLEARRRLPGAGARAFDWTEVVGPHRVQAQAGSICCWAYAAVAALEYSWAIRNGGPAPALAVQPVLDRVGKDGSGYAGWALQALLERGTCLADAYPHRGTPGKPRRGVALPYRAVAWGLVAPPGGHPVVDQLKLALLDHGPLVANVYYTPAFIAYRGGVYRERRKVPRDPPSNHILLLVGWDDDRGRAGCWKVQNSWGDAWGEGGFMWIPHGSNNVGHSACWVRAQATHYLLPNDIHERVNRRTVPFPRWPGARRVRAAPPDLSVLHPGRALARLGRRVRVRFKVRGGDIHSEFGHVELFSRPSWTSEWCLTVRILKDALPRFSPRGGRALLRSYLGRIVEVRGSVQTNPLPVGDRPIIELAHPAQIRVAG
jgi:hypothetical protein